MINYRIFKNIVNIYVDYLLLFFGAIIPFIQFGTSGFIDFIDIGYPYNPYEALYKFLFVWVEYNQGDSYLAPHIASIPILIVTIILDNLGIPDTIINRLWLIVPLFLLGLSGYFFSGLIIDELSQKPRLFKLIAGFSFMYSSYSIFTFSFGGIIQYLSLSGSIFFIFFFIKGFEKCNNKEIILCSLSSVIAVGVITYFLIALMVILIWLIISAFFETKKIFQRQSLYNIIKITIITCLLNIWWILPQFNNFKSNIYAFDPHISLEYFANFNTVLRTLIQKNSYPAQEIIPYQFGITPYLVGLIIIIIAVFALIISKNKNSYWIFFSLIFVLLFGFGGIERIGGIYRFCFDYLPVFYIFRDIYRFTGYIALFVSCLLGIFTIFLWDEINKIRNISIQKIIKLLFIIFIAFLIINNSMPYLSVNLKKQCNSFELPIDYQEIQINKKIFDTNSGYVLVYPYSDWFTNFKWNLNNREMSNPLRLLITKPIIFDDFGGMNLNLNQLNIYNLLHERTNFLSGINIIESMNIHYIIIQKDNVKFKTINGTNINHILSKYSNLIYSGTGIDIYKISDSIISPRIIIYDNEKEVEEKTRLIDPLKDPLNSMMVQNLMLNQKKNNSINDYAFVEINPTKYLVKINGTNSFNIELKVNYNPNWKIFKMNGLITDEQFEKIYEKNSPKDNYLGYINSIKDDVWFFMVNRSIPLDCNKSKNNFNEWKNVSSYNQLEGHPTILYIYYYPQIYYYVGIIISILSFFITVLIFICHRLRQRVTQVKQ